MTSRRATCTVLLLDSADRHGYAGPSSQVDDAGILRLARALRQVWPRQPLLVDRCVPGTDWLASPSSGDGGPSRSPYFTDAKRLRDVVPSRFGRLVVVRPGAVLLPVEVLRAALVRARTDRIDIATIDEVPPDVIQVLSRYAVDLIASAGAVPGCVTVAQAAQRLLGAGVARRDLPLKVSRLRGRDVEWDGQALAAAAGPGVWRSALPDDVLALPPGDRLGEMVRRQREAFDAARASLVRASADAGPADDRRRTPVLVTVPSRYQSGANAAWEEVSAYLSPELVGFVVGRDTSLERLLRARGFHVLAVADGLSAGSPGDAAALLGALDGMRPDVVHFDGAEGSTWAPLVFSRGARIVQHVRLNDIERFRPAFGFADAIVTVSEALRRRVAARVGTSVRVECIVDGVRLDTRVARGPSAAAGAVAPGGTSVRCLCVGRVEPEKGQLHVLEIVRALGEHVPCQLTIVGSCGSDPAYCDEVTSRVISTPPGLSATWRTFTHPVLPLYAEADVVLVGSRNEALGMVGLEALAAGCLLVARRSAGYERIVDEAQCEGLLFDGDQPPHRVASRILAALADADVYAANARRKAETCFDARDTADRLSRLWREIGGLG